MPCCGRKRLPSNKHIVIVGAGYGGIKLAEELEAHQGAHYTLINLREEFHHNMAACRAAVTPGFARTTVIPLRPAFGDHFKQGRVTSVNHQNKYVELEGGEQINYDVLVLCTGTGGPFPVKMKLDTPTNQQMDMYEKLAQKVSSSSSVVVIGGGPTGVEMAAEVATTYTHITVSLVTSRDVLPEISRDGFRKKVKKILERKGIKLVTGEKVTNLSEIEQNGCCGPVLTDKGSSIPADFVLNCNGLRVNADAYSKDLGDKMDERGRLRVNTLLQVEGHTDIFALGDCCNTDEGKEAYVAGLHGTWLASQLPNYFNGEKMKPYNVGGAPVEVALALGADAGLGLTSGGWTLPSWMMVNLKSKTLVVPDYWKQLHQKAPKS